LLLAGTLIGQDDDFPFGPFRMYATTDKIDAPVRSTRLEAVTVDGRQLVLGDSDTGLRRAEIEGQLPRFRRQPSLLDAIGAAYARRHPDGPKLARIDIVIRQLALRDGRPTGASHDTVDVSRDLPR
jgi:hypothetical protein